jgi:hydroxyacylglutathione hydrolase
MILEQFYLNCLAHASYLIGDSETNTAAVVDPQRDVDQYLASAQEHGLTIRHVFLTHFHADFVAGHLELRDRAGATIYLGAKAQAEYAFTPLADGDRVEFGRVRLQAIETPGHTPESISIAVYDRDRSDSAPHAVLTGDTLFVGDVGRPDLRVALGWSAADLGSLLYDSLRTKLLTLPDSSLVYPAHGAGSLCGKAISKERVSTIGDERRANYALQPMTRQAFVDLVTADQPDAPPYFTYDAVLNSKERPTLEEAIAVSLKPMSSSSSCSEPAGRFSTRATRRTSRRRTSPAASTSASAVSTRRGRAPSSTASIRSSSSPTPDASTSPPSVWGASASITWSATWPVDSAASRRVPS